MTTKKNTELAPAEAIEDATTEPSAEELREREQALDEVLADMPELHPPHALRIRERNKIMEIFNNFRKSGLMDKLEKPGIDAAVEVGALLADVDDFALSIAFDKNAYLVWSRKNANNYDAFMALLMRYTESVGE